METSDRASCRDLDQSCDRWTGIGGPDGNPSAAGVTDPVLSALIGNDDLFSALDLSSALAPTGTTSTQHYGPYPSSSGDSGTCGPDWATDTFDRHFTVRSNGDGTFTVVEQFKNGSFITNAGPTPVPVIRT
jgi:hypothetical protein